MKVHALPAQATLATARALEAEADAALAAADAAGLRIYGVEELLPPAPGVGT